MKNQCTDNPKSDDVIFCGNNNNGQPISTQDFGQDNGTTYYIWVDGSNGGPRGDGDFTVLVERVNSLTVRGSR